MARKLRLWFHDETHLMRIADDFEVEGNVLHIWRNYQGTGRYSESWYPLNSLRGWEWAEDE